MASPAIRIDRARLVNARAGDRGRLIRALDFATPAATGVAENALLLIPRMRIERPLGAGVEGFASELIDRIRAARVETGGRGSGAGSAFYFRDAVALEVLLVRAALDGTALPPVLREAVPGSDAPMTRWRRHLFDDHRIMPRVIAALVEEGLAAAWLGRFADAELIAAAERLVRAQGGTMKRPNGKNAPAPEHPLAGRRVRRTGRAQPPHALSQAIAAVQEPSSKPAARLFAAVALISSRQPHLISTAAFENALAELADGNAPSKRAGAPKPLAREAAKKPLPSRSATRRLEDGPGRASRIAAPRVRNAVPAVPQPRADDAMPPRSHAEPLHRPSTTNARRGVAPAAAARIMVVTSGHAGAFFLLNVFLALGLYGDFTDPVRRLRGLSPFELLLLLGRRWIGRGFEADPIAPLLRSLAGLGPRERPGRHFEAPTWSVPADWLAPWQPARPRIVHGCFRLSRWHAAGFPLEDIWRAEPAPAALRRRWVACLARYVEARAMRALDAANPREAVGILLDRQGSIALEEDRIEVSFLLDHHPLSIRLAGLDRDPGWIPAAGRSIGFRFA